MDKNATGTVQQAVKKSNNPKLDKVRSENTLMLLSAAEKGNTPWQNPEKVTALGMPYTPDMSNGAVREPYTGTNAIVLLTAAMEKGFDDPRWVDSSIVEINNMYVNKGEHGTHIEIADYFKRDEKGKSVIGENGKPVIMAKPNVYTKVMFNVSQLGNPNEVLAPDKIVRQGIATEPNFDLAEKILKDTTVKVAHSIADGGTPRYDKFGDTIQLPKAESFASKEAYYAEALHQLAHATGHIKRNGRNSANPKVSAGTPRDKEEELTGEIASFFLRMKTGIKLDQSHQEHNLKTSPENLKSCVMKENGELFNPHLFSIASNEAFRASNGVIKMGKELEQSKEQHTQTQAPENNPILEMAQAQEQPAHENAEIPQEITPPEVDKTKKRGRDIDRGR